MKRLSKNKKGFTFVEMLLVVAIIVILAAAIYLSATEILNATRSSSEARDQELGDYKQSVSANEARLQGYGF